MRWSRIGMVFVLVMTLALTTSCIPKSGGGEDENDNGSYGYYDAFSAFPTTPIPGATDVDANYVQVNFSRAADPETIDGNSLFVTDAQGNRLVAESITYAEEPQVSGGGESDHFAIYKPSGGFQPNTTYTVQVTSEMRSADGSESVEPLTWQFTMGAGGSTEHLTVGYAKPQDGAMDIDPSMVNIGIYFTRLIDITTINRNTCFIEDSLGNRLALRDPHVSNVSGTAAIGIINAEGDEDGLWFKSHIEILPEQELQYQETYTVTLASPVKDVAGNSLPEDYVWSFTTKANPYALTENEDEVVDETEENGASGDQLFYRIDVPTYSPAGTE